MIRPLALLLTVLTGFTGLVYEVTWQKYLATLLGSHSEATAAVLGLFLGGLSVGYSLFGRVSRWLTASSTPERVRARLLRVYGTLELSIGLYAFVFPFAFLLARSMSLWIPVEKQGVAFACDMLLSALLIGPPAVLMGATIPILTQALSRGMGDATRFHALVYGLNTAGAFAGALCAAFWLVPNLGLVGVLAAMGAINCMAGLGFVALSLRAPRHAPDAATDPQLPTLPGFGAYAAVALLVGFSMMAVQTVLIRVGGLSLGSSPFTFAMVVSVFVLCIALGSLAVSLPSRIPRGVIVANHWLLALSLAGLYFVLQDAPYWAHVLRSVFRNDPEAFGAWWFAVFLALLTLLGPTVVFSGASLPLLFHRLRHDVGELGELAGRLYSWNTVGSLLGALLGGYLLFFWLDLHEIYRIALSAALVAAIVLTAKVYRAPRVTWATLVAGGLALIAWMPGWSPGPFSLGLFRMRAPMPYTHAGPEAFFRKRAGLLEVLFYEDDATNTIAVSRERGSGNALSIVNNGKSDGNLVTDYPTMALTGLIPALLAGNPGRAFVVGYGTGVTVGELAALPEVEKVVVAEISRGVLRAAPFFDVGNQNASLSPKVELVRGDAYRVLLRSPGRYDVIASEPSNPWMAGVEMLYSEEFLSAAKARLKPGGVYAQWFHSYETDRKTIETVMHTYTSVFDDVAIWFTIGPDLLLLGFTDRDADLYERVVKRASSPRFRAGLQRAGIDSIPALLAHELVPRGVLKRPPEGTQIHTLLHPILSDQAARAFFSGGAGELPSSAHVTTARASERNSLLRRYARTRGGALSPAELAGIANHLCLSRAEECAVAFARWLHDEPGSAERQRQLAAARKRIGAPGPLAPALLRGLAVLFDSSGRKARVPSPDTARRATQAFSRYYYAGIPFERSSLDGILERCARDPANADRCNAIRKNAEQRLGKLEAKATPRAASR